MFNSFQRKLILLIMTTGMAACGGGGDSSGTNSGAGTQQQSGFSLAITDAAVDDALQVVVSFNSVTLKPSEGKAMVFDFEPAKSIDLLALQGNASQVLLDAVDIPSGDYDWIRLGVIADDCEASDPASFIELSDGSIEPLFVPSGAQSGLKLNSGFSLATGGMGDFVIDFDLRKSVVKPNGKSCHHLKPSMRLVDNLVAGEIFGTVEADLLFAEGCGEASAVYVFAGADAIIDDEGSPTPPLTSALVSLNEDTGMYEYNAAFMAPGDYSVAFTCQSGLDNPETDDEINFIGAANVVVESGAATQHDFTVPAPTTGDIVGTVDAALVNQDGCGFESAVYVYAGSDVIADDKGSATPPSNVAAVTFNEIEETYEYRASELDAGDYSIAFTCQADQDAAETDDEVIFSDAANVSVVAGGETTHDFTAAPEPIQ